MATSTLRGTNNTVANAPTPATLLNYGQGLARLSVVKDKATAIAQMGAGSIFKLGAKLPKDAVPVFGIVNFTGTSTATLKIGSADNDDLFGTATALATTPNQVIMPTVTTPLTADTEIQVLTATAAIVTDEVLEVVVVFATP